MRMSEKCRDNNNSDNPLTSRRTDGGKNVHLGFLKSQSVSHALMRHMKLDSFYILSQ